MSHLPVHNCTFIFLFYLDGVTGGSEVSLHSLWLGYLWGFFMLDRWLWKQNGSGRILIVQSNFKILHKGSKLAPGQDAAAYYCVNVFEALQCVAQWLRKQFWNAGCVFFVKQQWQSSDSVIRSRNVWDIACLQD